PTHKRQELLRGFGPLPRRAQGGLDQMLMLGGLVRLSTRDLKAARDYGQDVVEVMRHARDDLPHRLHALNAREVLPRSQKVGVATFGELQRLGQVRIEPTG